MTGWDARRARLRERIARRTPRVLTGYPFELVAAFVALLMAVPILVGFAAAPASLIALVGTVAFYAWTSALALGGVTVVFGLKGKSPLILASGLQLLGGAYGIYAIAVVIVLGLPGITALAAYACLSLVSLARAMHFRRVIDIQKGARNLKGGDQE